MQLHNAAQPTCRAGSMAQDRGHREHICGGDQCQTGGFSGCRRRARHLGSVPVCHPLSSSECEVADGTWRGDGEWGGDGE